MARSAYLKLEIKVLFFNLERISKKKGLQGSLERKKT